MALKDWTTSFESEVDDGDLVSELDTFINDRMVAVRERGLVEHDWPGSSVSAGFGQTGRHNPGSARAFFQTAAPTALRRPDGGAHPGDTNSNTALDDGRMWFDSDAGYKLYVRDQSGGPAWEPAKAVPDEASLNRVIRVQAKTQSQAVTAVSAVPVTLAWDPPAPIVTIPDQGTWDILVRASIHVAVGTSQSRTIRIDIEEEKDGGGALPVEFVEQSVNNLNGGVIVVNLAFLRVGATPSSTYEYSVVGEADAPGTFAWGGGTPTVGTGSRLHRIHVLGVRRDLQNIVSQT